MTTEPPDNFRDNELRDTAEAANAFELLRRANPVADAPDGRLHATPAAQALFEEITMTDTTTTLSPTHPRRRRRGPWLAAGAVAATIAGVLAVPALRPGEGDTARAEMIDAAETTEDASSGTVTVHFTGRADGSDIDITTTTRFSGDDIELRIIGTIDGATGDEQVFRQVDGQPYLRSAGVGDGWFLAPAGDLRDTLGLLGLPTAFTVPTGQGLVDLLTNAEGHDQDGDRTYRARTTLGDVRTLEEVPAGLGLFLQPDVPLRDDDLLDIEVTVDDDGAIKTLEVSVAGTDTNGAEIDVVSRTTYSGLGDATPIEAPVDAQPLPGFDEAAGAEIRAALDVLEELDSRRPGLCQDRFTETADGADEIQAEIDAFVTCLAEAGEPAAADAAAVVFGSQG